jgi:hypothetical protein
MDYYAIVKNLLGEGVTFNPSCFDYSEEEAREKKLWTSNLSMPTKKDIEKADKEIKREGAKGKASLEKEKEIKEKLKKDLSSSNGMHLILNDIQMWEAMVSRPASFVAMDVGFSKDKEVVDYASQKIAKVDLIYKEKLLGRND